MVCDCFLTDEEIARGELGCGEDCLNRLLMIEWCVEARFYHSRIFKMIFFNDQFIFSVFQLMSNRKNCSQTYI